MKDWQSQAHVKQECKYHVVILPKYRKKEFFGRTGKAIGKILRELCRQKDVELVEGKAMPDHIPMLISVPPKYSIAMTMGYLKGKSAIRSLTCISLPLITLPVGAAFTTSATCCEYCYRPVTPNDLALNSLWPAGSLLDSAECGI